MAIDGITLCNYIWSLRVLYIPIEFYSKILNCELIRDWIEIKNWKNFKVSERLKSLDFDNNIDKKFVIK